MVILRTGLLAALFCVFSTLVQAQPVTATLDRTEIVRGETVILTIRVEGQSGGVDMDLSPLEAGFQVISTRTSSQISSVNNSMNARIDYHLTLFPLNEGEVTIPPLVVAGETTPVLTIQVEPRAATGLSGQELFMEAVVSKDAVYVQEQLLFSIRLYYTISGIRNPIFTELELPDAVVQTIGTPNQYETLVDGMRYGVYEKQYAIFPQRSGTLEIPDIMFRGEVTDSSSNYVFRNLNTRTVTSYAEGHTINVTEKPASYPADALWLPASELTVRERWDNDFTNVRVGDSVYRVIEIEAQGLDGAALPPLEAPQIDGVNTYPEPAAIDRTFVDGSIVGKRTESTSFLMTAPGTVRVPGVSVPWYDIDTSEVKYATLADSAISVGAARSGSTSEALLLSNADMEEPTRETFEASTAAAAAAAAEEQALVSSPTTPLWILTLAAALTALIFALTFVRFKPRAPRPAPAKVYPVAAPMYRQSIAPEAENKAFKDFINSCSGNNLPALRLALIGWGRQYFADADLHTLDAVALRTGNAEIREICLRLQQALYGQGGTTLAIDADIRRLQQLITELRTAHRQRQTRNSKDQDYIIPPLYKA
jgi:hypothetical protein